MHIVGKVCIKFIELELNITLPYKIPSLVFLVSDLISSIAKESNTKWKILSNVAHTDHQKKLDTKSPTRNLRP